PSPPALVPSEIEQPSSLGMTNVEEQGATSPSVYSINVSRLPHAKTNNVGIPIPRLQVTSQFTQPVANEQSQVTPQFAQSIADEQSDDSPVQDLYNEEPSSVFTIAPHIEISAPLATPGAAAQYRLPNNVEQPLTFVRLGQSEQQLNDAPADLPLAV